MAIIMVVILIWLIVLTFQLRKFTARYQIITKNGDVKELSHILENLMKEHHLIKRDIGELVHRCDTIEKNDLLHIQKIGLLRFNPFKDTGGD